MLPTRIPPKEKPKTVARRLWEADRPILQNMPDKKVIAYVQEVCASYTPKEQDQIYWALCQFLRDNSRPAGKGGA